MIFEEFWSNLIGYLEGGDARPQFAKDFLGQPPEQIIEFVEPENFAAIMSFAVAAGKVPMVISEVIAGTTDVTDSRAAASSAVDVDAEDDLGEREDFGEAFAEPTDDPWSDAEFVRLLRDNPIELHVDPRRASVKQFLVKLQAIDPFYAAKVALCLNYGKSIPGLRKRLYTPKEST